MFTVVDSPVGPLTLVGEDGDLSGIYLREHRHMPPQERFGEYVEGGLPQVAEQLQEYFARQRTEFELPLRLNGTPFQRTVWAALQEIPYGETISYGELAQHIGRPTASRAVGLANGKNPVSIVVPCHRVIGSTGDLTGYGGGIDVKRSLLHFEREASELSLFTPA
ncbi:methylated-DNA--[protein]-cysteine S-methyltransferase [Amycolatopsis sp.]|uniref:methylated-DNA--[protein]-cysteine S-methyltransferase n=1 Tax=Amycolatopsis sp. TaxID=37632 RepID=UPI002C94A4FA|nr:methylated-DNA--[protein]-cysteine S-methyltransferase [Amycolatopsis sp.]HVV08864.1 methylated-DNA--[protein]-cysteine S-methyltransferase [Amycolatopsis sp.]